MSCSAVKLNSRNNLITKLAGTSWGASVTTLRTSALTLCYSIAEYCCPVWARSSYTDLIDTKLHSSMHLISDCLQPRQLPWLPVLSNVAPPSLRRKAATDNMLQIIEVYPNWLVYADIFEHPLHGLHLDTQYGQVWHLSTQLRNGERTGCQLLLSSDQLRAASLIGRNAVTWLWALSNVRRSSDML